MIEKTELANAEPDARSSTSRQATRAFIRVIRAIRGLSFRFRCCRFVLFVLFCGNSPFWQLVFRLSSTLLVPSCPRVTPHALVAPESDEGGSRFIPVCTTLHYFALLCSDFERL